MVLTKSLQHLVGSHGFIQDENLAQLACDTSIDLRIGNIYNHEGNASLTVQMRVLGDTEELMPIGDDDPHWMLEPHTTYLAATSTKVALPDNFAAIMLPRSSLMRAGIICNAGYVDPGYCGRLHFAFSTTGPGPTKIGYGFPAVQLVVLNAERATPYNGVYQGGASTKKNPI